MQDDENLIFPPAWEDIQSATAAIGFPMASNALTGAFLRTLTAAKPGGRLLELGTGTGLSTAWIVAGMDRASTLLSVDNDPQAQAIARTTFAADSRISFVTQDGGTLIESLHAAQEQFDFIFADTWPGKYTHLEQTLALVAPGGFYVVDDMLPQPNWPADHPPKVVNFIATMEKLVDFAIVKMNWGGGLILATRLPDQPNHHRTTG